MTLNDLFTRADSRELGLWLALYDLEAKEQNASNLAAKAQQARLSRSKK
jgi:hypothetical protein